MRKLLALLLIAWFPAATLAWQQNIAGVAHRKIFSASVPTFTYGSGTANTVNSSQTVLTSVTTGDLVVCSVLDYGSSSPTNSVSDGTNTYHATPNSPSDDTTSFHRHVWIYYSIGVTGGTLTITSNPSDNAEAIYCNNIHVSGPAVVFDADAAAGNSTGTTPANTPCLTPSVSGEFEYSNVNFVSVTAWSPNSPWSPGAEATAHSSYDGYILSGTISSTCVNFTGSGNTGGWSAMTAAFK